MTTTSSTSASAKLFSIVRQRPILSAVLTLVGLLCLALVVVYFALQTETGRYQLARFLETTLSQPGQQEVVIGRIDGELPGEIRIDKLALADGAGTWLKVHDFALTWSWLALFQGRIEIDSVAAKRVDIARRPATDESAQAGGLPGPPPLEIVVRRATVDALSLDESLLGAAASLRAAAELAIGSDAIQASLEISRIDSVAGHVNAEIDYDPNSRSLDLHAELSEPRGGLTARLLQLPRLPAIDLSLVGEGPAAGWRGTVTVDAEDLVSLDSGLTVSIDGQGMHVASEGTARPGTASDAASAILGPQTEFAVALSRSNHSDRLSVAVERLRSAAIDATATADLALKDGDTEGEFHVATRDATRVAPFFAPLKVSTGSIRGKLSGPLTHPAIDLNANFGGPEINGWSAEGFDLQARIRPDGPLGGPDPVHLEGLVSLTQFQSPVQELNAVLGDRVQVTVAQASLQGRTQLNIGDATLTGAAARSTVVGDVEVSTGRVSAQGELEIDDMSPLSERAARSLAGRVRSRYDVSYDPADALSIGLRGTVHDGRYELAVAEALLGTRAEFAGKIDRSAEGGWTVSDASIRGDGATATGRLSITPNAAEIAAEFGVRVSDLAALGIADPERPVGYLDVSGTVNGPSRSPAIEGTATLTAAAPGGFAVRSLTANFALPVVADQINGRVRLEGETVLLPDLSGQFAFAFEDRAIALTDLQLAARGAIIRGSLAVPLAGPPVSGTLTVDANDLGRWSPVLEKKLAGSLKGTVTLSADSDRQQISLKANATGFALEDSIASQDLTAAANITDALGERRLAITVSSGAGRLGPLKVQTVTADFAGTVSNADIALRLTGEYRGPLHVQTEGTLHREGAHSLLTLTRLEGEALGVPLALANTAAAEFGTQLEKANLDLTVGDGTLEGTFRRTPTEVSIEATVRTMPLVLFWPDAPPQMEMSRIDANAVLKGPVEQPHGRFDLWLSGLAAGEAKSTPEGLALNFDARLQENTLTVIGRFKGIEAASAKFDAKLPVRVSLSPLAIGIDDAAPASGRIDYTGPIKPLVAATELDRHRLQGEAKIQVTMAGSLRDPHLEGSAALTDGRYENLDSGTILTDITLRARGANNAITIETATAGDGNGGRIAVTGDIGMGGATGPTINLDAAFETARLVRRDEFTAVSSGTISLRGDTAARAISGRLDVDEAEIRLIASTGPSVVQIEVEETGTPPAGAPPPSPAPKPSNTQLDVTVSMPKRMFVRGRGLDSEWGGEIRITGTTASPRLQGSLYPLRGRYDFLGKIFTLRDGSIEFTGAEKIDPLLDLSAERSVTDLTAIIKVTGTASKPELNLDSIPQVPQDEVLSRILFNKSTGRLGAMEAVQLGQAAAAMTGATSGGGIVDFGRRMLNLDVLQFNSTEDTDAGGSGETSVEAGKYITDDVYIGVESGPTGTSGATVEIEVTPNLRIDGDVGQNQKGKIGLKWKRDY